MCVASPDLRHGPGALPCPTASGSKRLCKWSLRPSAAGGCQTPGLRDRESHRASRQVRTDPFPDRHLCARYFTTGATWAGGSRGRGPPSPSPPAAVSLSLPSLAPRPSPALHGYTHPLPTPRKGWVHPCPVCGVCAASAFCCCCYLVPLTLPGCLFCEGFVSKGASLSRERCLTLLDVCFFAVCTDYTLTEVKINK